MKTVSLHNLLISFIGVSCCALITSCGKHSYEAESGIPTSRSISASRVVLPAAGGQTIQVPTAMMADTYELWRPLNDKERQMTKRVPGIPAGSFDSDLAAWLPPTETDVMQRYLYRLTHSGRDLAVRVLGRAESYLPVILASLRSRGLPDELACLPMVESAFEPRAVSPAGAAGLWQLMPETARRFGLVVNSETDERFDIHKSTAAATAYLAALYSFFGDWPLALAAYNCGEGSMQHALSRTGTHTLSGLTQACRVAGGSSSPLAEETLRFVPRFAAAVHIMTNSNSFGLTDHAVLHIEQRGAPTRSEEPALVLLGRYEAAPKAQTALPRIQRME